MISILGACSRRRWVALRVSAALVGAVLAGCEDGETGAVAAGPETGSSEFRDKHDLLRAIEQGTFAERAGVDFGAVLEPPEPVVVRFVRGTDVPEDELPKLRDLAERLRDQPTLGVDLEGCSDPPGPADVNRRISQRRAEAVAAALRELGAESSQIRDIVGRGEDCDVPERAVHVAPFVAGGGAARS